MSTRVALLFPLLLLGLACRSSTGGSTPEITVVLLEDGSYSLNGQPVADYDFPAAYTEVARRYEDDEAGPSRSRTRIHVEDPAGTTWARLLPALVAYAENYGESLHVQGQELLFPICWECATVDRHVEYAPIRIVGETNPGALRGMLEPAEGGTGRVYCRPTCSLDVLIALLHALDEAEIAYRFAVDPPVDDSLIMIMPDLEEEEEPENW